MLPLTYYRIAQIMRSDCPNVHGLHFFEERYKHILRKPQAIKRETELHSPTAKWCCGCEFLERVHHPVGQQVLGHGKRFPRIETRCWAVAEH